MDKVEANDEEINVEEIMRKIRENIKKRKESENLTIDDPKVSGTVQIPAKATNGTEMEKDLEYIESNWDIRNNSYYITSHRPFIGKALITGRELVHGEVRRYVDPMIWKQNEFNSSIVKILNNINEEFIKIRPQIEENSTESQSAILDQVDDKIDKAQSAILDQVDDKIDKAQSAILDRVDDKIAKAQINISDRVGDQVRNVISAMNDEVEKRAWLFSILDSKIAEIKKDKSVVRPTDSVEGVNYFVFEERFRGSQADLKNRQASFIEYFQSCKNVLDIGCGRGEFLELLREHGIGAKGVDIDEDMVNFCRSKGLDVEKLDAISYLEGLEDKSLDGIFIDQVVEHLDPDYLIRMIRLCYQKLIYGGTIAVETVNPLSFFSFSNFYIDMSHKRPIHPETLKFLLDVSGFREIDKLFFAVPPEEKRLIKMDIGSHVNEDEEKNRKIYNYNIDIINNMIFGPQDYAIIGRK